MRRFMPISVTVMISRIQLKIETNYWLMSIPKVAFAALIFGFLVGPYHASHPTKAKIKLSIFFSYIILTRSAWLIGGNQLNQSSCNWCKHVLLELTSRSIFDPRLKRLYQVSAEKIETWHGHIRRKFRIPILFLVPSMLVGLIFFENYRQNSQPLPSYLFFMAKIRAILGYLAIIRPAFWT